MQIKAVRFCGSSTHYTTCPSGGYPELALVGRSNVGKSSLINMLMHRKGLAKVSSKPGKTQLINHFLVNEAWYLVDLPGYGWAKASHTQRHMWQKMLLGYLSHRPHLHSVFVLLDARLKPQEIDMAFVDWLYKQRVTPVMVFTKADKVSKQHMQKQLATFQQALTTDAGPPRFLVTSARQQKGQQAMLAAMGNILAHKSGTGTTL
ncbi:MAG: ribosome biogenesis GTP-binding protein YihA/YsxC [Bacteroidota bacterium]